MNSYSDTEILEISEKWLQEVVIGLRFCPFAARPYEQDRIRFSVCRAVDPEGVLQQLMKECQLLIRQDDIETSLLIMAEATPDFDSYLDLLEIAEKLLKAEGYEGEIQLASFHPDYTFDDSESDDPANYTNRSPFPMFHLIREDYLEAALEKYPHPESVPENNVRLCREKGLAYMKQLRESCFHL